MKEWRWVAEAVVHALHDRQLAEHGGGQGVRDAGLIASGLARPQNLANYGDPDAADLAAAYAFGLCRNHGFVDGNKRTAWITARLFLSLNGYALAFDKHDALRMVERLAAGELEERAVAEWFRARLAEPQD